MRGANRYELVDLQARESGFAKDLDAVLAASCSPITASFQRVGLANTAGVLDLAIDFAVGAKNPLRTRCVIRCCIDER